MDILNWLYLVKNKFTRTTIENPATDLVVLGADVSFQKRGDKYQNYAVPAKDFIASGLVSNTAYYEFNATSESVVTVTTQRGIIDIIGMGSDVGTTPDAAFGSSYQFSIDNPALDLTVLNRDNVYVQYSVYYDQAGDDNAIPYVISTGFIPGLEFTLYNANPAAADTANWSGSLYLYYEIYVI